jgi:hypothetical protein
MVIITISLQVRLDTRNHGGDGVGLAIRGGNGKKDLVGGGW